MSSEINKIKEKIHTREDRIKNGNVKLFNWGWYKFAKCIFGTLIYSIAVNLFIVPNHLYTGGILRNGTDNQNLDFISI